jgi:sigma-B regulation protein RsbU (phosphoserine phosphatase)
MNILLVEEDISIQELLQRSLSDCLHSITIVATAKEALSLLLTDQFELILSNWHRSDMTAPEFCRLIRQHPSPSYCYIILYTTGASAGDLAAAMDAGSDDILSIPLESPLLGVRVRAAERILTLRRELADQNSNLNILNTQLGAAYKTIQADLEAASALQLSLLPTISKLHRSFCLEWLLLPSSFLAGDNLNYFMMQQRYILFYHLDVAGHGIPSALLAVTLNHLLSPQPGSPMVRFDPHLELKRIVPPVEVVGELNRRFQTTGDGYFTMIYGVLDTETHEIRFCQAGHPSPLKVSKDGTIATVGDGGFPVGLWPNMTYDETVIQLMPGERLLLYSDGIFECVNNKKAKYSMERLQRLVSAHASSSVKELLNAISADLELWCEGTGFGDDVSLLVIESM